jgi:hypothetical protein
MSVNKTHFTIREIEKAVHVLRRNEQDILEVKMSKYRLVYIMLAFRLKTELGWRIYVCVCLIYSNPFWKRMLATGHQRVKSKEEQNVFCE